MKHTNFENRILYYCIPVISGLRCGCTITLDNNLCGMASQIIKANGSELETLYEGNTRSLCFIFNKPLLERILERDDIKDSLSRFKYKAADIRDCINTLTLRYKMYKSKFISFPHEMGILLNIPPPDVFAFILNKGRNFLLSGYWKVYSDADKAKKLFEAYDKAREQFNN